MVNYQAIHKVYSDFKKDALGGKEGAAIPQPVTHGPMHKMVMHAMAMTPNKDGETHGTMVLRALTDHLKRVTPDVNHIHKDGSRPTPDMANQPRVMAQQ